MVMFHTYVSLPGRVNKLWTAFLSSNFEWCLWPTKWLYSQENSEVGMSENGVYPQWNSHLVGIMISKTMGCRGTLFSDKPKWCQHQWERKTLRGEFFSDGVQMFGHNRITDQWLHSRSSNKKMKTWLVVYLPLWKIWVRQWEGLSHILWKIKNGPKHQPGVCLKIRCILQVSWSCLIIVLAVF